MAAVDRFGRVDVLVNNAANFAGRALRIVVGDARATPLPVELWHSSRERS